MSSHNGFRWARKPEPFDVLKRRVDDLLYLGTVDKIMNALAYEFGADRKLPARSFIRDRLDRRNNPKPYGGKQAEGWEL